MPWSGRTAGTLSSKREAEPARVLGQALRYVRTGVRSTRELRAFLTHRGLTRRAVDEIVGACRGRGLLDDRAGARLWVEHWARQGYGWSALQAKLSAKGFDEPAIRSVAASYGTTAEDVARARRLVASRIQRPAAHSQSAVSPRQVRLARTLASRGFDADVIERVLQEAFGSSPAD